MIEAWLRLSEMIASCFIEQRLEHAAIGVETGGEHDRVRLAQVPGDRLLELAMQSLRSADEAHRSHAEAELVHGASRRRDDVRVIGEAEIIVGAEIDRFARALRGCDTDAPALRPGQQPLAFCQALGLDVVERGADVVEKGFGHGGSCSIKPSIAAPRERSNRCARFPPLRRERAKLGLLNRNLRATKTPCGDCTNRERPSGAIRK